MKKISKILSSVLAISLVSACFTANVMAASKVHTLAVSANKTEALNPGETIVVEVKIDNTLDLVNVDYDLVYDASAFEVDTTVSGRNPANFIDKDWFNDIKNADGDWQYYAGTPTINGAEAGAIYFRSAGGDNGTGVEAAYAQNNRLIGKYSIKVKDGAANGTYEFKVQNGKSLDFGEVAVADMAPVSVTVTVGEDAPAPVDPTPVAATAVDAVVGDDYKNCGFKATLAYDAAMTGVKFVVEDTANDLEGTKSFTYAQFVGGTVIEGALENITVGLNITNAPLNAVMTATAVLYK